MQALVHKILQRIIHKAVALNTRLAGELRRRDTDPEMGAVTGSIGAHMARMLGTFVQHLQRGRSEALAQTLLDLMCRNRHL